MRRYQQADGEAADRLVTALNPILARYFYGLAGGARHIDDLIQECWLRIHRARHTYRSGEAVLPWVFAIARHTRIDLYRRWQRSAGREGSLEDLAFPPLTDPRPAMETNLEAESIKALLGGLPEGQREVLVMLKTGGMSVEEVARATGSTAAAVKQKAYRAYKALRLVLGLSSPGKEHA
ncbi:MAG: RNA polymerase sigma factor [Bryobacterales bacterium]|nr:RNA polymerase sigma factor [Bryobacterales bacterium]